MIVNYDLLMSEVARIELLKRLYDLAIMIHDERQIEKGEIAAEILNIVSETELYQPCSFFQNEKAEYQ